MAAIMNEDELVWQFFGCKVSGFFIEVGANDPESGSQTWMLEQKGWSGILVEPQKQFSDQLKSKRPKSQVFCVACGPAGSRGTADLHIPAEGLNGFATLERNADDYGIEYERVERVELTSLDELCARSGHRGQIDFVSLDTEGTELEVLRGFDLAKHRPALILLEDKGTSMAKHRHLTTHGYKLVKRTQLNNWYVPRGTPFRMTTLGERLLLWRKVFAGYPGRKFRHWRHHRLKPAR